MEKIGKDGSFHKRLNKAGIHTVEDFLRVVVRDPQKLRKVRFLIQVVCFIVLMACGSYQFSLNALDSG